MAIMVDIQTYTEQPQTEYKFNPNEHLMQIKNKGGASDYLPVQWRLVWFRSLCPGGTIETEVVHLDLDRETEEEAYAWNSETRRSEKIIKRAPGLAIFRATVRDGKGGVATGTKSEKAASFPDYIEKAETGAIGRALAALGYGTQFAPELDEQHRIVDAPVEPHPQAQRSQPTEAEQKAYRERRKVVEADAPAKDTNAGQSPAVQDMSRKAALRAKAIGISTKEEWNAFILDTLGKQKPTGQWDLADVAKINGALTSRENGGAVTLVAP